MSTLLLKKYEEVKEPVVGEQVEEKKQETLVQVTVTGSMAEIVAKALYASLDKKATIAEVSSQQEEADPEAPLNLNASKIITGDISAISTEDINRDPVSALRSVKDGSVVYVYTTEGFKTKEEDWFLLNVNNKASKVVFSQESIANAVLDMFITG